MPRPPAPWDAIYDSLFLHAQQQVFGGNQVGPSGYTTLEDLLTNTLAWFGLNLVQQMGSSNAPIVQAINAFTDAAANNVIAQTRAKGDQLIGNLNAAFAALTATVDGDFNALSKQIAGGAGGPTESLSAPLGRLADVIIANADRLEPILYQLLTRIADAINGVSGAGGNTAKTIATTLAPALGEIAVQLANTGTGAIADAVTADTEQRASALERSQAIIDEFKAAAGIDAEDPRSVFLQAGVPNFTGIVAKLPQIFAWLAAGGIAADRVSGGKLTELLPDTAKNVLALGEEVLVGVADHVVKGIKASHGGMNAVMGGLAKLFFEEIDGELATLGQADEDTVLPKAQSLLTIAASLGATAHLFSIAAESAHGAKHLGLNMFGAFLTDLAGFQKIADHSFGVQYEAALRSPARRRANKRFRAEQPMIGDVTQMWYEGRISENDLRRFLAEQGWEDFWIDAYVLMAPIEASPRDLALVFEDGGIDLEWAIGHLTERGFLRDDAERIANGVRTKSLKSARQAAITNVMNAYEDGLLEVSGVVERLRPLRLSDDAIQLYLLGSDMTRFRAERRELRAELLAQASTGLIDDADVVTTLAAWGYDPRAQSHTASLARARGQRRVLQEEAADTKAATRRRQTDAINAAQEEYRRFQLDDAGLSVALTAAGVAADETAAIVQLARVRRTPTPRLAEVLTPEAQAQREREREADRVAALLQKGIIDGATAQASLIGLGVDPADARSRVNLDRKSTRLNSSHLGISYAVFCLKKK